MELILLVSRPRRKSHLNRWVNGLFSGKFYCALAEILLRAIP
jgi:hypothetical protein